jgi:hypothetical protein
MNILPSVIRNTKARRIQKREDIIKKLPVGQDILLQVDLRKFLRF